MLNQDQKSRIRNQESWLKADEIGPHMSSNEESQYIPQFHPTHIALHTGLIPFTSS